MKQYPNYMPNMQGGNNLNFNKCNYNQDTTPNNIYDPYAGFIRGNMFPDLYNQYDMNEPLEVEPMNEQAQLLTYYDALCFAALDMNLYLDNYPNNRQMIDLFNQYRVEADRVKKQYENTYGPLFTNSEANASYPWAWNQSPWPWEN